MSGFSLKDHLFNRERVTYLANQFHAADSNFDKRAFIRLVMKELGELELKQRITHIASTLERFLSPDFTNAAEQIVSALPPPLDENLSDDDFGDFIFAPLGEFVVRNGLDKKHLRRSLRTLKEITKRFSMEDAIRAFIREFPDPTLIQLTKWTTDRNYHVRRLVSEGTRPSLPWSGRIGLEPLVTLPLLDQLHSDATRYVTRSVSNHLNDISKTDPKLVIGRLTEWRKLGCQDSEELEWMTRHSLRTLVKQGNRDALKLMGYRPNPKIEVGELVVGPSKIKPGQTLQIEFSISALRDEPLMVDYVIEFVKANGSTAPKVFKAAKIKLAKGETKTINKRHPFRANATTFTLYPGTHRVSAQINGKRYAIAEFEMKMDGKETKRR